MNLLTDLLHEPATQRLGWTLLHFLWQGLVLAAFFALLRAALRERGPNARYLAGCVTLLLMVAAPVATFVGLGEPASGKDVLEFPTRSAGLAAPRELAAHSVAFPRLGPGLEDLSRGVEAALPWLVLLWLAGVAGLSLRLCGGWYRVRRLQRSEGQPLEASLGFRLLRLQSALKVSRPVRLLKSALVDVPTVIGWFRPLILLPAGTLTGLTPVQLDLILAHELAHLRRWDHWANLAQLVIETLLFYHPAVWWVSRSVRDEREHCCDELAVSVCGDRLAYAHALAALEGLRQAPADLTLAAAGGSLLARIRRVLGLPDETGAGNRWSAAGKALLLLGLAMLATGALLSFAAPKYYRASTLVGLRLDSAGVDPLAISAARTGPYDPFFVATESAAIRSSPVLVEVVQRLGLARRWGEDAGRQPLTKQAAVQVLASRLRVLLPRGGPALLVCVTADSPQEAAEIANAVAAAYKGRRDEARQRLASNGLRQLREQYAERSGRVTAKQNALEELRRKLDVRESATDAGGFQAALERERVAPLLQKLSEVEQEYAVYRSKLDALKAMSPGLLRKAIVTVWPSEQILPQLYADLNTLEQNLAAKLKDFSPASPEVVRLEETRATIQRQIEDRLTGVMAGLESNVAAAKARMDSLRDEVRRGREYAAEAATAAQGYFQLKRELEDEERVRDSLLLRSIQEEVDAQLPARGLVEILDRAEPLDQPFSAAHPLDKILMAGGLLLALTGSALRWGNRTPSGPVAVAAAS